jgi:isocitrate dehydrogenase
MAIAENDKSAKALAKKEREVYYLFAGQSVRQTIDRWAAINHYKVIYQTDVNFTVSQDTTVYGGFLSKGGALAQLLGSLKNTSNPIKATATSNHVLLIQANEYNPALLMPNRNNANNTNIGA